MAGGIGLPRLMICVCSVAVSSVQTVGTPAYSPVAVLPDGRVFTGSRLLWEDWRALVWDPAKPRCGPVDLGSLEGQVGAVAVLPDGRVVTGDDDGRVPAWDPDEPGTGPVEFGRHQGGVTAVAVLPDGRMVTSGHHAAHAPLPRSQHPFPIRGSPLHRPHSRRNLMLGDTPSGPTLVGPMSQTR